MSIDQAIQDYEDYLRYERRLADLTVIAYLSDLRGLSVFLGSKPVASITTNDLRAYMRELGRQGFKNTSIRRKFHGFGTFWRWLKMEGYTNEIATEHLLLPKKPKRVVQWLNERDLRTFIQTPVNRATEYETDRDRLAWLLLAWLGLRRSEVLNLEVIDVRILDQVLVIRDAKGNKDRVLPIPPEIMGDLRDFIAGRESGFLFEGRDGGQWKVRAFNRAFARHLKACGLANKGITPHTLRHTFATHMVAAGVPLPTVSKLLGHDDIQSTMVYVHVDLSSLQNAIAQHVLSKLSTLH